MKEYPHQQPFHGNKKPSKRVNSWWMKYRKTYNPATGYPNN